jgi:ligand-binding sensor domain-containing protein
VDGKWLHHTSFDGVGVYALLELGNDILVGTDGAGVYQVNSSNYDLEAFDVYDDCDTCNVILALYSDSKENIWVGSFGGARRIEGQKIVTFDESSGLSGDWVTDIREDSFGNIWVGSVQGSTVSRISGNHVEQISFSNGLPQNFVRALEMDKYDYMWVGTVEFGLYKYDGAFMGRIFEGPPGNTIRDILKDNDGALWIGTTSGGLARFVAGVK